MLPTSFILGFVRATFHADGELAVAAASAQRDLGRPRDRGPKQRQCEPPNVSAPIVISTSSSTCTRRVHCIPPLSDLCLRGTPHAVRDAPSAPPLLVADRCVKPGVVGSEFVHDARALDIAGRPLSHVQLDERELASVGNPQLRLQHGGGVHAVELREGEERTEKEKRKEPDESQKLWSGRALGFFRRPRPLDLVPFSLSLSLFPSLSLLFLSLPTALPLFYVFFSLPILSSRGRERQSRSEGGSLALLHSKKNSTPSSFPLLRLSLSHRFPSFLNPF